MAFTLEEWLKEFATHCPRMRGVSVDYLQENYGEELGRWATRKNEQWVYGWGTSQDAFRILSTLAHIGRFVDGEERHAAWVRSFDWKDSDGWGALPALMGLTWPDLRQDGWRMREVGDLLLRCNQIAAARKMDERFYSVETHGDDYVIVMLSPAAAQRLVSAKVLDLDVRPLRNTASESPAGGAEPIVREDPLWRLKAIYSGKHSDLLPVLGVAFLAFPVHLLFRDLVFTLVPVFVALLMLRDPVATRVSWLRWLKR